MPSRPSSAAEPIPRGPGLTPGTDSVMDPFSTPRDSLGPRDSYLDGAAPALAPPIAPYRAGAPSPGPSIPGTPAQRDSEYDPYVPALGGANETPLLGAGAPVLSRASSHANEAPLADAHRESPYGSRPASPGPPAAAIPAAGAAGALAGSRPSSTASRAGGYGAVPTSDTAAYSEKAATGRRPLTRRPLFWAGVLAALAVVAVVIAVPVALTTGKHGSGKSSGGGGGKDGNGLQASGATSGGDGSKVTTENGTTFVYANQFGGTWVYDPAHPFNDSARCNSWTPPLSEKWDWTKNQIHGVNLGGWLVLEPFIVPHFYQKYKGSVDEWTLSTNMMNVSGSLDELKEHYATFITEEDIAQIAGAGLSWVRLPIPYWAVDKWDGEPFLEKVAWPYIVKLFGWCRKYGIRVNLDLHTIPGSQNGYNHSGRLGGINWLNGAMGIANAQRSLDYIRFITEFISQPEYVNVVPIFSIVNEALLGIIGIDVLSSFYLEAHNMIRNITGVGNGAYIAVHDGFQGTDIWKDFLPGADRFIMDQHPYLAFGGPDVMKDPFTGSGHAAGGTYPARACNAWRNSITLSQKQFGVTIAGEFSNGWNDCGLFLHGIEETKSYAGDCTQWQSGYTAWDQDTKDGLKNFAMASMDTLENWFFWTWKIGPDINGVIQTPLWSYKLGLDNGWMPTDPRTANGTCASYDVNAPAFDPASFAPSQTGAGNGQVDASVLARLGQWPPATLSGLPANVPLTAAPVYTPTGAPVTLAMPTITDAKGHTASFGADGWAVQADNRGRYVPVQDCVYPDPWTGAVVNTAACTGTATATVGAGTTPVGSIVPPPTSTAARRR